MDETKALAQLVLCIPGPWEDRGALLERIIRGTKGDYLYACAPAAAAHGKLLSFPMPVHQEIMP